MLLLVIGFSWFNSPSPEEIAEQQRLDSLALAQQVQEDKAVKEAAKFENVQEQVVLSDSARLAMSQSKFGIFAPASSGKSDEVFIENNKIRVTLDTKGGMIREVVLIDGYKRYSDSAAVELWVDSLSKMKLSMNIAGKGRFGSDYFYFTPSQTVVNAKESAQDLTMRLNTADPSKYLELTYHFEPNSYSVPVKVNVVGLGNELSLGSENLNLEWAAVGYSNEKGLRAERSKCSVYYRENEEDRDYLSETGDQIITTENGTNWVAFKQDYFSAAVISKDNFKAGSKLAVQVRQDSTTTKKYFANLALPIQGETASTDVTFYFGPNDFKELKAMEVEEFYRIIDYGWSIIGVVNRYLIRPLFWFFSNYITSFGLIILLVTLIIKMVLFPITWKNFLSSAKMRVLKPEMDEINKKFEGADKQVEKQQAIMGLYRQTGVNPFAGCIPVLLQMPILYAMFRFFPAEIVLRGKSFLWADDLASYDSIFSWSQNIPILSSVYGNHVSGFTLLMAASTFIYTRMSMASQPTVQQPGMPNMKVMMNLFAVMMLFFMNSMPAGLSMYYFTANVISIGQMYVIKNYIIDEDAIRAKIESNKSKPKKKSSFSQRLEQIQKDQQKKLDNQKKKLK